MSAARRTNVAALSRLRPVMVCLAGGIVLSACTNFKQVVGLEPTSPDEFAVESRAPLTIPPEFNLRPPAPGAPRPQETSMADKARGVVDNAGPGEPGKQASGTLKYQGTNLADPNAQIADQSLSAKLLQAGDSGNAVVVEKRQTTALKDVY